MGLKRQSFANPFAGQAKPETEAEADQVEGSVTGPWVEERKRGRENEKERESAGRGAARAVQRTVRRSCQFQSCLQNLSLIQ